MAWRETTLRAALTSLFLVCTQSDIQIHCVHVYNYTMCFLVLRLEILPTYFIEIHLLYT